MTMMTEEDRRFVENRTLGEIQKTRKKDCHYCRYEKVLDANLTYCDYLNMNMASRPCHPGECRKAGVFSPKKKGSSHEKQ